MHKRNPEISYGQPGELASIYPQKDWAADSIGSEIEDDS